MDFHRMRAFLVVAEELHFRRAAQRLQMTPSPLSKQIREFEREMGGPLFVRQYHRVTLTPLGESLVEPVRRILEQVDELQAVASRARRRPAALRLAATALAPPALLEAFSAAAARFSEGGELRLAGSSEVLAAQITAGELDLALVHVPLSDQRVQWHPMSSYALAVAMRAGDPLASSAQVDVADLAERLVIAEVEPANPTLQRWLVVTLAGCGVRHITSQRGGGAASPESAARVRHEGAVALIGDVPGSTAERVYASPHFTTRPMRGEPLRVEVALAWSAERLTHHPGLLRALNELTEGRPAA